ncbi:MAG: hypothetical protein QXN71_01170 [Candidatus Aenigmatarchaeota archaeon]
MPAQKKPKTIGMIINEIVERLNSDTQRLRVLEQSYDSVNERVNMIEQAILQNKREMLKSFSSLDTKLSALDDRITRVENTIKEIVERVKKLATTAELKELESLIEIYNPVKSNFVTREELDKILKERKKQ